MARRGAAATPVHKYIEHSWLFTSKNFLPMKTRVSGPSTFSPVTQVTPSPTSSIAPESSLPMLRCSIMTLLLALTSAAAARRGRGAERWDDRCLHRGAVLADRR